MACIVGSRERSDARLFVKDLTMGCGAPEYVPQERPRQVQLDQSRTACFQYGFLRKLQSDQTNGFPHQARHVVHRQRVLQPVEHVCGTCLAALE